MSLFIIIINCWNVSLKYDIIGTNDLELNTF